MYFNDVKMEESKKNSTGSDEDSESCSGSKSDKSQDSESEDEFMRDVQTFHSC